MLPDSQQIPYQPGVEYPIKLGSSFDTAATKQHELSIVSYDFMPHSVDVNGSAKITIDETQQQQVTIDLPTTAATDASIHYTGKYERSAADKLECVAIFEGDHFRLELLDAQAIVKHAPGDKRDKMPPPPIITKQRQLGKKKPKRKTAATALNKMSTRAQATKNDKKQPQEPDVAEKIKELFGEDGDSDEEDDNVQGDKEDGGKKSQKGNNVKAKPSQQQQRQQQRQQKKNAKGKEEAPKSELERSFFEGSM